MAGAWGSGNLSKNGVLQLYSTGQVAKICGCAARTVSKWIDGGLLRGCHVLPGPGGDRRVPRAALLEFLRDHRMPVPPALGGPRPSPRVLLVGCGRLGLPAADGVAVARVEDAFGAGASAAAYPPSAAVLDLAFGRAEMLAVCRNLARQVPRPFLVATAYADEPDPAALTDAGFDRVFYAPVNVAALAECLRAANWGEVR